MAQTRIKERLFALILASVFLLTSVGVTVYVIYANNTSSNNTSSNKTLVGTQLQSYTPSSQRITKLQIIDNTVGKGETVQAGQKIVIGYTGALANSGIIFDSSLDRNPPTTTLSLSQVIQGWQQGVPGMKVGGSRRLLIPASLAYGNNPPQGSIIPTDADLVFDITLLGISK